MASIEERIAQVRDDRAHGSRWLVRETISILRDIAASTGQPADERRRRLRSAGRELVQARPAMAAIAGAAWRILGTQDSPGDLDGIARTAEQLLQTYDRAVAHITEYARPLLGGTLMTHSLSGTVLDVLTACAPQLDGVVVLEGRPRYEGRAVAEALSKLRLAVTLITDAQAAIFLPRCSAAVVGADSVLADGSVLNKAGTALIGWAARGLHRPLYVLSETLKIAPYRWTGDTAQLEEKEASEVLDQPVPGVTVRNFYFDYTPASLVTKLITEQGLLASSDIRRIAAEVRQAARRADIGDSTV